MVKNSISPDRLKNKIDAAIRHAKGITSYEKKVTETKNFGKPSKFHMGPIRATVAGRTDHLPMHVPPNSYVIPADIVSALGEGNTENGFEIIDFVINQRIGSVQTETTGDGVAILAAGGEYVIPPAAVESWGNGDIDAGHKALDDWVKFERKNTVKTLSNLPGPKKD